MNIKSYTPEQLDIIRAGGKILAEALQVVRSYINPGVSTLELDKIAEDFVRGKGAEPSFKGYNGYAFTICASVNEESIHGIPKADKILRNGDIVSVDIGVRYKGFCTDAARTWPVGEVSEEARKLIEITEKSFWEGIRGLRAMHKVSSIGERVENFVRANSSFSIIENYFGHGVGEKVHENPLIPNYKPMSKALRDITRHRLPVGSVIAIEPMLNAGVKEVETAQDGWTAVTVDGKLAAHYENTVIVLENGVEVVTI